MTFNTPAGRSLRLLSGSLLAAVALGAPCTAHAAPMSYGVVTQGYPQDVRDFEFRLMGRGDVASVRFIAHWPLIQAAAGPCLPARRDGGRPPRLATVRPRGRPAVRARRRLLDRRVRRPAPRVEAAPDQR